MSDKEILQWISERERADIFDLLYETSMPYPALRELLDRCVAEGTLGTEDGRSYVFLGDKTMFDAPAAEPPAAQGEQEGVGLDLEAERIRASLRDREMQAKVWVEADPDTALTNVVLDLRQSILIRKEEEGILIDISGLTDDKYPVFCLTYENGKRILSDRGSTLDYLAATTDLNEIADRMEQIMDDKDVILRDGEFTVEIGPYDGSLARLFDLYAAMEQILRLGDDGPALERLDEDDEDGESGESDGSGENEEGEGSGENDFPSFYIEALRYVIKTGNVSASGLCRELGFGFSRAYMALEWMEAYGFIGPRDEKTGRRPILLTKKEFIRRFGPL